jgi:hypothetical protein
MMDGRVHPEHGVAELVKTFVPIEANRSGTG